MPRRDERNLQPLVRQDEKDEDQREDQDGDQERYQDGKYEAEKYDFLAFMRAAGFEEDELLAVIFELDAYKSIPGTTLRRYVNRVQSSVEVECRPAFLKGLIVGTGICENLMVDRGDLEGKIEAEVRRRVSEILLELETV